MKKSLFSVSMAALLASTSMTAGASSVTIPNSFTAGTTAVAADVNANFSALATGVNDNDTRITTNTGNIGTNTTNIGTNTTGIATNVTDIATNAAGIATNVTDIATNAADITALQGAGACPSDMVAVGPICVDIYEASVFTAATGGTQIADGALPCLADGSDCGANAANPIYARSVAGVIPAAQITWYQAAQACANVGKRLPSTAEWQMAASGTPAGINAADDPTDTCNVGAATPVIAITGASSAGATPCVSSTGAFDMVGNLWEWSAELTNLATAGGFSFQNTDSAIGRIFGSSYNSGSANPNTQSVATVGAGPSLASNSEVGFRCVK